VVIIFDFGKESRYDPNSFEFSFLMEVLSLTPGENFLKTVRLWDSDSRGQARDFIRFLL